MDIRIIAARIELLQNSIETKRDAAAKMKAKLYDPRLSSICHERGPHDNLKRQRMMTDYLDKAAQLEQEIEPLQNELSNLRDELRKYLDTEPLKDRTRRIIRMHLLYGFSWAEVSEMPGYRRVSQCKQEYISWLESIS